MADKKYSVILEKVGNQPLMTTKILCGELGLGLAKAKGLVDKVPSTIATDLEIAKALELKKKLEEAGNTVSILGLKIEAEPTAKKNVKSSAVSSDDAFAAIFGGSTTPKTTTVKKQSTSGTTPKTTVAKAEPKKTTSKAPAASSDSFDSLFGGAAPKKETKTQPKASVAKTMRKEYSNGFYEGDMKDGEPHGFGTYRWNDGDVYTGEYVNGTRHGKGKFVFVSGNYYDGEWVDGKYNGHGIFRWSDGGEFDGEWKNGKRHGKGKWTYTNGSYYTGVWENGENVSSSKIIYPQASSVAIGKSQGQTISSKSNVLDCSDKATQAYNNKDYFRCAYYLHRGGLSGDDFYCRVSGMCYHPSGATGYDYVEKILTSKSLKYISDEDIDVCAFVLDKFVPKGTKDSKIYRAWCYYRAGRLRKAAGMIPNRGLMFYNGRIQDISEVLGGRPLSSITPYSDEIMANLFRCKLWVKLDMENDWVSQLRKNERLKEKLLLAEEYVKFAKKERWEYELREVEEDVLMFKAALR